MRLEPRFGLFMGQGSLSRLLSLLEVAPLPPPQREEKCRLLCESFAMEGAMMSAQLLPKGSSDAHQMMIAQDRAP